MSFRIDWLITLQSKGLARVFSNTTIRKRQFFSAQPSLWTNSHICTWLLEKPYGWIGFHCIFYKLFAHSSISTHIDYFHVPVVVTRAAVNMSGDIFCFSWIYCRSESVKSYGYTIFNYWETSIFFYLVTVSISSPINSVKVFPFLHILTNFCYTPSFFFSVIAILTDLRGGA